MTSAKSLRIQSHRWGMIRLEDGRQFKDVKLWPGHAREWDWNETGTRHSPGIQLSDLQECLETPIQRIILSKGRLNRLRVPEALITELESKGYQVAVLPTDKAIISYNESIPHLSVAALIHSTC
ncbi:MAG: hypothetical protein GXO90_09155 [FCB group bacterium]|nr:hypothetical protein [FCB group bacterium]